MWSSSQRGEEAALATWVNLGKRVGLTFPGKLSGQSHCRAWRKAHKVSVALCISEDNFSSVSLVSYRKYSTRQRAIVRNIEKYLFSEWLAILDVWLLIPVISRLLCHFGSISSGDPTVSYCQ